jgi:hypothetical protein
LAIDKIAVFEKSGTSADIQSAPHSSQNGNNASPIRSAEYANSRMVHKVSMRMKYQQYGGATTEYLMETINLYTRVASDYELNATQKLKYFHNEFKSEALRYYDSVVAPSTTIFAEAMNMMVDHFNSRTRQNKAKELMKQLHINSIRVRERMTTKEALEYIRENFSVLAPQCTKDYGTDTHRADALAQAVRGEQWALETLKVHEAEPFSYQTLYQRLESAFVFSSSYFDNSHLTDNVAYTAAQARPFRGPQSVSRLPSYKKDLYGTPRGRAGAVCTKTPGQRAC